MAGDLITTDGQAQFGDTLLMGAGTPYEITDEGVLGWEDLVGFDDTDVLRPSSDGAWQGKRYAQRRTVTIPLDMSPGYDTDGRTGVQLLRNLQRHTRLHRPEEPLVIRAGGESLMCWARINTRIVAAGKDWLANGCATFPVQFIATDPRRYGLTERSLSVGPPVRSEGLLYTPSGGIDRIDYVAVGGVDRLDWGVDGSSGDVVATNNGTESTPPVITITGPCTTPAVTLTSDELGQQVLEYAITLAATDTLTIDVRRGSVLLNAGTSDAERGSTVRPRSALLSEVMLPPGDTALGFRAAVTAAGAGMTVSWRDAYM